MVFTTIVLKEKIQSSFLLFVSSLSSCVVVVSIVPTVMGLDVDWCCCCCCDGSIGNGIIVDIDESSRRTPSSSSSLAAAVTAVSVVPASAVAAAAASAVVVGIEVVLGMIRSMI